MRIERMNHWDSMQWNQVHFSNTLVQMQPEPVSWAPDKCSQDAPLSLPLSRGYKGQARRPWQGSLGEADPRISGCCTLFPTVGFKLTSNLHQWLSYPCLPPSCYLPDHVLWFRSTYMSCLLIHPWIYFHPHCEDCCCFSKVKSRRVKFTLRCHQ